MKTPQQRQIASAIPYLLLLLFVLIFVRNILGKNTFFAWDMVPRFSINQIIENSLYLWDPYLNRPNFRAIQSMISIWMLYYRIQWIGIIISYTTLMFSTYFFFKKFLEVTLKTKNTLEESILVLSGVIISSLFIYISEGYWYHSIILSTGFMLLAWGLAIDYIYISPAKYQNLYWILLIISLSPMVTYNYLTILLLVILYIIIKIERILTKTPATKQKEDHILIVLALGSLLYGLRVILPSIQGATTSLEYHTELSVASVKSFEAIIPISRISYFYTLSRFGDYITQNPKLTIFYIFPILSIIGILSYPKNNRSRSLFMWLSLMFLLSIFSATGHGIYDVLLPLTKIPYAGKLASLLIYPIRKPTKWLILLAIIEGLLVTMALRAISSKLTQNHRQEIFRLATLAIISLLILSPFLLVKPINEVFSGDLGEAFSPVVFPREYLTSTQELTDGGMLIFPVHVERPTPVIKNKKMTDEFLIYFYNRVSYEAGGFESYPYNTKYVGLIYKSLVLNESNNISPLLSPLGISHIVLETNVSYDIPHSEWKPHLFSQTEFTSLKFNLGRQRGMKLVFNGSLVKVYKNNRNISPYISDELFLNLADIDSMTSTLSITPNNPAIINIDSTHTSMDILPEVDTILLPTRNPEVPLYLLMGTAILIPSTQLKFEGNWASYQDAYIGMSELSRYYKTYHHLGFPTYSKYPYATGGSNSSFYLTTTLPNGEYELFLRAYIKTETRIQIDSTGTHTTVTLPPTQRMEFIHLDFINVSQDIYNSRFVINGSLVLDSLILIPHSSNPINIDAFHGKNLCYVLSQSDFKACHDNNSMACAQVDIIKPGHYGIYSKNANIFEQSKGALTGKITLSQGTNIITLPKTPDSPILLCLRNNASNHHTHKITSYKIISPVEWKFTVHQDAPGVLVFPEAYDPYWEAIVRNDSTGKTYRIKPILGYSSINLFYINQTGTVHVTVYYKPQNTFWLGLLITGITLLGAAIITALLEKKQRKKAKP